MTTELNFTVQELKEKLLSADFIAMNFCSFESATDHDIEHYQLLKPGDEIHKDCADLGRTPIISDEAEKLLALYLDGKLVKLHPDPVTEI